MLVVELEGDDFHKSGEFVFIGSVAGAIARAMGATDNLLDDERKIFPRINAGVQQRKLNPLHPENLTPLSKGDYGIGIVRFEELVEWGKDTKLFEFTRTPAPMTKEEIAEKAKTALANARPRIPVTLSSIPAYPPPDPGPPFRSMGSANLPSTSPLPDWIFWAAMPEVELWQACALAHNIDPDAIAARPILDPPRIYYRVPAGEDVVRGLNQILKLLLANEFEWPFFGQISTWRYESIAEVRLRDFAKWCVHISWPNLPRELAALAQDSPQAAPATKTEADPVEQEPTAADTHVAELGSTGLPHAADERLRALAENKQLRLPDWIEISGIKMDEEGKERRYKITKEGIRFIGWPEDLIKIYPPLEQADMLRQNEAPGLTFPCTPNELVDFVDSDAGSMFGSLFVPDVFRDAVKAQSATDAGTPDAGKVGDGNDKSPNGDDWEIKAGEIADKIGLERWTAGIRQISPRNINEAVATKLGEEKKYWGNQGPRASSSVRNALMKIKWKFIPPSGTNGTNE